MKPITPNEVMNTPRELPPVVYEIVNKLIQKHWNGSSATFKQDEVVALLSKEVTADLFKEKYLDFEQSYRQAGWSVVYDGPGYNESYPATFTFRIKKA